MMLNDFITALEELKGKEHTLLYVDGELPEESSSMFEHSDNSFADLRDGKNKFRYACFVENRKRIVNITFDIVNDKGLHPETIVKVVDWEIII